MNVNSTSSVSSNNGFSGMISGMDTEALVQSQLANIQNKIDKQEAAKQQLEWKQEQYRGVITKVNDFYDKYFDIYSKKINTIQEEIRSTDDFIAVIENEHDFQGLFDALSGQKLLECEFDDVILTDDHVYARKGNQWKIYRIVYPVDE